MEVLSQKKIIVPKFTHNAIPTNVNEIKEIYDLINESKYKNTTLYSSYRHIESLQFQTFVLSFTFIKYNKKVKNISNKLIRFGNSLIANYNCDLFCINTNSHDNSELSTHIFKIVMEKLFPERSPYEIIDYSLASLSFNIIKQMKQRTNELEKELSKIKKEKIKLENLKNRNQIIQREAKLIKLKGGIIHKNNIFFCVVMFSLILIIKKFYHLFIV